MPRLKHSFAYLLGTNTQLISLSPCSDDSLSYICFSVSPAAHTQTSTSSNHIYPLWSACLCTEVALGAVNLNLNAVDLRSWCLQERTFIPLFTAVCQLWPPPAWLSLQVEAVSWGSYRRIVVEETVVLIIHKAIQLPQGLFVSIRSHSFTPVWRNTYLPARVVCVCVLLIL